VINLKLKEKSILALTTVIFLAVSFVTYCNIKDSARLYKEAVMERIFSQLSPLQKAINGRLAKGEDIAKLEGIDKECRDMLTSIKYGRYCFVMGNKGNKYYHTPLGNGNIAYNNQITQAALKSKNRSVRYYALHSGEKIYDFFLPLNKATGEQIGLLRLGVQSGVIDDQVFLLIRHVVMSGIFFVFLASSILFILFKHVVLRSMRQMLEGITKFTRGEFSSRVKVNTNDEIGEFAESFNNMAGIVVRYIDALKKAEENLRASKDMLEYQKKSLEDINKELDDFTYIVSHDLKEPLRSIDAYSKFVMDDYCGKIGEEGKHYLERIRANAERMKKLIDDLLELSRLKRKGSTIEEVETEKLISEVKARLEYTIKEKGVEIIIKNKLPKIFCDSVRLTEVFFNLISNAIKFNDKQKPVIEIGCEDKGGFYEFYVKDNGIGIKEEYFDKIFEIFQRLGKREDSEGTGAGLTIVKKIVQMHKGKAWVESKTGEGSVFYFTIPKEKSALLGEKLIGEILVEEKLVTEEEIEKALEHQRLARKISEGGLNDGI